MRLPTPFVKLPLAFDAEQLAAEISQFKDSEWTNHPQGFAGNTALVLVSHGGGDNNDDFGCMAATARLQRCPYLLQVFASFNTVIGRSRLMRLAPGAEVTPHCDIAFYWHDHVRIHVPIVTDPGVRFTCDGVETHMAAGEAWIFDNWRNHHVLNHSGIARIHLVIDTIGSAAFWRLVSQGSMVSQHSIVQENQRPSEFIGHNSAHSVRPAIEKHNRDAVVHPDTVLAIVQELLVDLRQSRSAQTSHAQAEMLLVDFAHNWRALWAEHGNDASGHGRYRQLLQETLQQAEQTLPDIRLSSNGMPLIQILQSYLPALVAVPGETAHSRKIPRFDRPIIILAAPRSGSTLLYESLARHPDVWSLGIESHGKIENLPGLSPVERKHASNVLLAEDADPPVIQAMRQIFAEQMRNGNGLSYMNLPRSRQPGSVRFLEKTPKNALRVPFLNAAFEDALFIFLHRSPPPNIASMIEAWRSGKFITYRALPGWHGIPWSLLLIPGWETLPQNDLPAIAAHQWSAANGAILDDLEGLPVERWCSLSYEQFTALPAATLRKLWAFCQLPATPAVDFLSDGPLPLSRHTLTPPAADKWQRHKPDIQRVMDIISPVQARIDALTNRL